MRTSMSFWMAFLAALGAMLTIAPRSGTARAIAASKPAKTNDTEIIADYFQKTWEYMAHGVQKSKKVANQTDHIH